jgi:glycosyltransferase involved in cell wall biosynthesis
MLEPWSMRQSRWKKSIAWRLYQERDLRAALVFHATSDAEAESIRGLGFRQPIAIVPNGVTVPPLLPDVQPTAGKRIALFLSRLHPKKGVIDLIEAWARVRPAGWLLQIAGHDDGGHQADIERAIFRNSLSDLVSLTGGVSDAEKWKTYRGADLFILPTKSENFGIVIAEALACGLPVITTRGAPWQDLLRYQCGWWVDLSVEALTSAIEVATAAPIASLREMGRRGRVLVEKELSWARAAREMRQLYEWATHQGTRPEFVIA